MLSNELKAILLSKNFGSLFSAGGGGEVFPDALIVTASSYTIPVGYGAKVYIATNSYFTSYAGYAPYYQVNGKTCYVTAYAFSNGRDAYGLDFFCPLYSAKLRAGDIVTLSGCLLIAELYLL